jgi:anhydro-N-acetylmuramic acid kinase
MPLQRAQEEVVVPSPFGRGAYVVGLMSGTSTDGVDAALIRLEGAWPRPELTVVHWLTAEFPEEMRDRLLATYPPHEFGIEKLSKLNVDLGEFYAATVLRCLEEAGVAADEVLAVGSRGITIGHFPANGSGAVPHRIEIAEPAIIAERTGIDVVSNHGARDQAVGGMGVLSSTAYVDWMLFGNETKSYAIQNFGGIGNVGYVRAGGPLEDVRAFDTGPGNVFIDMAAADATSGRLKFDRDGELARQGRVCQQIIDEILDHPFFSTPPPRSTGRELFGLEMYDSIRKRASDQGLDHTDLVATMTSLTVQAVALTYERFVEPLGPVDEVVVVGGGAYNPALLDALRGVLEGTVVTVHDEYGIPSAIREAVTFAVGTARSMHGLPTGHPGVTGATRSVVLGSFTPGRFHWKQALFR